MSRLLGAGLLLLAGVAAAQGALVRRRQALQTMEGLLCALHRLESAIRCERRPLYPLFDQLAAELTGESRRFFRGLLEQERTEPEHALTDSWEHGLALLTLPPEGLRIWRELGHRLVGDAEELDAALRTAEEEMRALHRRLERALPEQRRILTALSLSASAFLAILLL